MRGQRTLPVVADIINAQGRPMRVPEIMDLGGTRFQSRAAIPQNVIWRDIALSIRDDADSPLVRVGSGLYSTLELECEILGPQLRAMRRDRGTYVTIGELLVVVSLCFVALVVAAVVL